MELISQSRNQPNGNGGRQNKIINEEDQLEEVNPSGQNSPNTIEDKQKNGEENNSAKTEQSEIEKGSEYKDGPKRDDSQPPGN